MQVHVVHSPPGEEGSLTPRISLARPSRRWTSIPSFTRQGAARQQYARVKCKSTLGGTY